MNSFIFPQKRGSSGHVLGGGGKTFLKKGNRIFLFLNFIATWYINGLMILCNRSAGWILVNREARQAWIDIV